MTLPEWNDRYRTRSQADDHNTEPALLVIEAVNGIAPGKALDLACGTGRNAIFLAQLGWQVTAVDGSSSAIEILKSRTNSVQTQVADLQNHGFKIVPAAWDLILSCYYLQRDLFPEILAGAKPGGVVIAIAHIPVLGQKANEKRVEPGELRSFFSSTDWKILHDYEGPSRDPSHKRPVAEIVALRTATPNVAGIL